MVHHTMVGVPVRINSLECTLYIQHLTNGGVVDVVVGSDHAQVQRRHIHLVLDANAFGLLQVTQGLFYQF